MTFKIRVAVIDIYPIFREAVVRAVERAEELVVVGDGESAADATRLAGECDVLLLEPAVPNSLYAAEAILKTCPNTKVIFFSAIEDDEHARRALHLGVHGYLMKEVAGKELVNAIKASHVGMRQITPELAWRIVRPSCAAPLTSRNLSRPMSVREQEVLDHASRGLTNKQMAHLLGLNISTVKRYKTRLFRRLGVRNRMQAIAKAVH